MKKKKITGKLSLQKSKISRLNSSKIYGGVTEAYPGCVTWPALCGATTTYGVDCDTTFTLSANGGSECKCL